MAVDISPDRKQVRGLQSAKSTHTVVYSLFVLAGAKSRISEMLISLRRSRKPSKSAVFSKMILVSLGHDYLSL